MPKMKITNVKVEAALFRKARSIGRSLRPPVSGQGMVNVLLERALAEMTAPKQTVPQSE